MLVRALREAVEVVREEEEEREGRGVFLYNEMALAVVENSQSTVGQLGIK